MSAPAAASALPDGPGQQTHAPPVISLGTPHGHVAQPEPDTHPAHNTDTHPVHVTNIRAFYGTAVHCVDVYDCRIMPNTLIVVGADGKARFAGSAMIF